MTLRRENLGYSVASPKSSVSAMRGWFRHRISSMSGRISWSCLSVELRCAPGGARPLGQDLFVGGGPLLAPEAEHSLESGHGRASAVEAEGELVEVDLQVLLADAAVGALQPGLEVAYHPMDPGKDLVRVLAEQMMRTLAAGLVVEAKPSQPLVSRPAIGGHGRPGGDALGHEVAERVGGAGAADLNGHDDQCLDALLAATPEPRLVAADEALVDLDNTGERRMSRVPW